MINRCPTSQGNYVYNISVFLICIHIKKCKSLYELNDKEICYTYTLTKHLNRYDLSENLKGVTSMGEARREINDSLYFVEGGMHLVLLT